MVINFVFHSDPKFFDRQVWENSSDPSQMALRVVYLGFILEPRHGKTNIMHMQKQRRRSASR